MPFPGPPEPPKNVEAEDVTTRSCVLKWKPPEFDGGSPITGYYVESSQHGYSTRWTRVNRAAVRQTRLEVKDLIELTEYIFRVVAENEAGLSKPSEPSAIVMPKDPFSKPGQTGKPQVGSITRDSASLTWTPPKDTGNCPITNYVIESRAVGGYQWTPANARQNVTKTEFTVTGLKEGTEYEFRVSAENKVGQGPPSETSQPVKYGKWLSASANISGSEAAGIDCAL